MSVFGISEAAMEEILNFSGSGAIAVEGVGVASGGVSSGVVTGVSEGGVGTGEGVGVANSPGMYTLTNSGRFFAK